MALTIYAKRTPVTCCLKILILVSGERSVQYRERSAALAHSTLRLNSDVWFVECATAALRSRYCTDRSRLTKIRVFVQSSVAETVSSYSRYGLRYERLLVIRKISARD